MTSKKYNYRPSSIILFLSLITIAIGTLLLMLPFAHTQPISLIDALFTSISASTGTGLLSTSLQNFTPFGLIIITLLAQIGALGIITMTILFIYFFFESSKQHQLLPENILKSSPKKLKQFLFFIIIFTLVIELIGGIVIAFGLRNNFIWHKALLYGLFHSISAFSSLGISLFDNNMEHFAENSMVLIPLITLMLLGIIGFITIGELLQYTLFSKKKYTISLSSKITLITTGLLLIFTTGIFLILEGDHALAAYNPLKTILNSIFNATSCIGIGFHTVPVNSLQAATILVALIVAFIGTAPGSTGSGIQTTTVAIFWSSIRAVIWGHPHVTILGKKVSSDQVRKATAIIALSVPWIIFTTFILLILEPEYNFLQILFESVSAFATFGMSMGITPYISTASKLILCISMLLGRIGPFTLIFIIKEAIESTTIASEEAILLG